MSRLLDALTAHRQEVEDDLERARKKGAHTAVASLQRHLYTLTMDIAREEAAEEKDQELTDDEIAAGIADGVLSLTDRGLEIVEAAVEVRRREGRR